MDIFNIHPFYGRLMAESIYFMKNCSHIGYGYIYIFYETEGEKVVFWVLTGNGHLLDSFV